jgi:hypothetical protein
VPPGRECKRLLRLCGWEQASQIPDETQIPITAMLTSASLQDSRVAIPLAKMTAKRVTSLASRRRMPEASKSTD